VRIVDGALAQSRLAADRPPRASGGASATGHAWVADAAHAAGISDGNSRIISSNTGASGYGCC
jgi:hypothetical protein